MNSIQIDRLNYYDQLNLTFQLCSAMLTHENITHGERALTNDLLKLLEIEINTYSMVGLSSERDYWKALKKQMQTILKQ